MLRFYLMAVYRLNWVSGLAFPVWNGGSSSWKVSGKSSWLCARIHQWQAMRCKWLADTILEVMKEIF